MKAIIFIILFCLTSILLKAQPIIEFNKFPVLSNDTLPIKTEDLLKTLNWESIKEFCKTTEEYHSDSSYRNNITEYKHLKQGYENHFRLGSYKGLVLYFESDVKKSSRTSKIDYFDKNVWLLFANDRHPYLPDSMKLNTNESSELLMAYYNLLGVNAKDEYGWICEYSTVGMEPTKRTAVIRLIKGERYDLLRKLIKYPNPQTQVYAADALIFLDYLNQYLLKSTQKELAMYEAEYDSLLEAKKRDSTTRVYRLSEVKEYKKFIEFIKSDYLLTPSDWQIIYELRDSNQPVIICGNSGSYKTYQSNTSELLSDKAISEIPQNYINLDNELLRQRISNLNK